MNKRALLAYALALVIIAADQALKWYVVQRLHLDVRGSVPLFGPFAFTWVENRGVSFGVLNIASLWSRWGLSLFSAVVAIFLAVWVRQQTRPFLIAAIGLIMGGAVGNLIDRIRIGYVVDFIDATHIWYPYVFPWIFNIADSAITVGAIALIWDLFLAPKPATAA